MKLFEPIRINSMVLENRIVLPAMVTRLSGEDGYVNKDIRDRYLRFAKGEVGLIVLEAMAVHTAKSGPLLRICDDQFKPGLAELARMIHDTSPSKVVPQIIHFLKISRSGWRQKISDLSIEEIKQIVINYADAAMRAQDCGFDGVELHMAHAYTLSSFLSAKNARNDAYGRTLENRMRLMSEVIVAVRKRVGASFPVGVRFDGEECIKGGYTLKDSQKIALRMAQLGVDYISISAGGKFEDAIPKPGEPLYPYTGYSGDRCMPSADYPDGANVYLAEGIKQYINSNGYYTPVIATGKISTPELAEQILESGRSDLIGMARALLADPDWPKKVREGRWGNVIRCIYCNVCKSLDENFRRVTCTLWPKGSLQAPYSDDKIAPTWSKQDPLGVQLYTGCTRLVWSEAKDNEGVYGYDIFRSENGGPYFRLTAVKRLGYWDTEVVGGNTYSYYVQAYDFAGNRSEPSNKVEVTIPFPV
ncbi:MAG: NADH:flavin oxidoreductase [Acidobacteriota bacterium]|nr:NADH:flavin oxidoreductase [Blastocatellia bacterium]MDW8413655.1 NADH:flavin oxidoreductase [Acidobacteriota bacterium]